jgi:hypothetical protein
MPSIHFCLDAITLGKECRILWAEIVHDCIEALPEVGTGDACARKNLLLDEVIERSGNLKAVARSAGSHAGWAFMNINN